MLRTAAIEAAAEGGDIWYIINLHAGTLVAIAESKEEGAGLMVTEAKRTGCTYVLAPGVLFEQGDAARACVHMAALRRSVRRAIEGKPPLPQDPIQEGEDENAPDA